jgi:hypothetical protein
MDKTAATAATAIIIKICFLETVVPTFKAYFIER